MESREYQMLEKRFRAVFARLTHLELGLETLENDLLKLSSSSVFSSGQEETTGVSCPASSSPSPSPLSSSSE